MCVARWRAGTARGHFRRHAFETRRPELRLPKILVARATDRYPNSLANRRCIAADPVSEDASDSPPGHVRLRVPAPTSELSTSSRRAHALTRRSFQQPARLTETLLWEHKKKNNECLQNGIQEHTVAAWVGDTVKEIRRTYSHLLKDHGATHGAFATGLTGLPKATAALIAAQRLPGFPH